jgi:hypothetical protein
LYPEKKQGDEGDEEDKGDKEDKGRGTREIILSLTPKSPLPINKKGC